MTAITSISGIAARVRTRPVNRRLVACSSDGQFAIVDADNPVQLAEVNRTLLPARDDRLGQTAAAWRTALRRHSPEQLDYLILVPTLRCSLSCSYCQVSRVSIAQPGFDWSDATLNHVLEMIDGLAAETVKIEFQGGEPTLRCDLIEAVIDRCARFKSASFVICTNLEAVDARLEGLIARSDVHISTSLDGDQATHHRQRAGSDAFRANLRSIIDRHGASKVSALPTVDSARLPEIDDLIDAYAEYDLTSIFLRPITYHGFARKRHSAAQELGDAWRSYHRAFVARLIERNWQQRDPIIEETYLSICLRRILQPGRERHVDLREPNPVGRDYLVIDHDGKIYPTDEARMLARSGVVDLALGDVATGWDSETRRLLDRHSTNQGDPACEACAYQPYCGRDLIDDLARYGRIDLPRHETEFCKRHLHMFDLAFELLDATDPATRYSVARWLALPGELPLERLPA